MKKEKMDFEGFIKDYKEPLKYKEVLKFETLKFPEYKFGGFTKDYKEGLKMDFKSLRKRWINYPFFKDEDFKRFARDYRKALRTELTRREIMKIEERYEIKEFKIRYFYFTCFVHNLTTNKFVYISISDVRFFKNWWCDNILIRTAENSEDYMGGANNWCKLEELIDKIAELTKE